MTLTIGRLCSCQLGNFVGVGIGMINMLIYAFYGLAFGFGSWLIHSEGPQLSVLHVMFSVCRG